jgi:hypothetical protein
VAQTTTLDLSAIDANEGVEGNQAFTLVDGGSGAAGELWIIAGPALGGFADAILYADVDGGGEDMMVLLYDDPYSMGDQLVL